MFMVFDYTVRKYHILKKSQSFGELSEEEGYLNQINNEGSYYFKRDMDYLLEINEKILLGELRAHPFGGYLIGVG